MRIDYKKLVHSVSSFLLRFLIYATATATVLLMIAGSSVHIKEAILATGAYERFVPSIIEANQNQKGASIPLDDPKVVQIINDSFPPKDLQKQSEAVIDSVFTWLKGESDAVRFTVDFTINKQKLGEGLSEYAFTQLAFKPDCIVQPAEFDPFSSPCRPLNYDIFKGQKEFADQITSSEGFLGNTILTESNLPKNKDGKHIFEQFYYAPSFYAWINRAPILLGVMTLASGAVYVASTPSKRKGAIRLGKGILGNSITLIVTPYLFGFAIPALTKNYTSDLSGSSAEVIFNDILNSVGKEFDRLMIWFGSVLLLVGIMVLLAERMTRSKNRYNGVERHAGLVSSNEKRSLSSPRGRLNETTLPLQSSESSVTKKPKKSRKNAKYRKIPL